MRFCRCSVIKRLRGFIVFPTISKHPFRYGGLFVGSCIIATLNPLLVYVGVLMSSTICFSLWDYLEELFGFLIAISSLWAVSSLLPLMGIVGLLAFFPLLGVGLLILHYGSKSAL
ncbi:MAG: hypothetical protein WCJ33_06890 [Pseudomonadota bacterium]